MSRVDLQRSRSLVLCGLFLAVLANLGLTVHSGHHSLALALPGSATHLLTDHAEPDPTLHLESATEVRTLSCPGCQLQQQVRVGGFVESAAARPLAELGGVSGEAQRLPLARFHSATRTRGPPNSC